MRDSNVIFLVLQALNKKKAPFKCYIPPRSISHKRQQPRFKCNVPRCISHKPKQARSNCNIPRSIRQPQEARFKCDVPLYVPLFISHKPKHARFKCNIPRSVSHMPCAIMAFSVTFLVL